MKRIAQGIVMFAIGGLLCLAAERASAPAHARTLSGTDEKGARAGAPAGAAAIYAKRCATCHGNDGRAKTLKGKLKGARNLTDAQWQADVTDERIYNSIANGRDGGMPAFHKKLTGEEIQSLVGYVRSLKK